MAWQKDRVAHLDESTEDKRVDTGVVIRSETLVMIKRVYVRDFLQEIRVEA